MQINVRVGIDIGGVLVARKFGPDDTMFTDRYLESEAVVGAFDATQALVKKFSPQNVFIISKCGEEVQRKSTEWLHHTGFFEQTGFDKNNVRFCRTRAEKAPIAQKLRITHFIDDRAEVLSYMTTVPFLILLGSPNEIARDVGRFDYLHLARIWSFPSWPMITDFILTRELT